MHATYGICPNFFVILRKKYFFTRVISHDLRFKLDLIGLIFMANDEALKKDLSDTSMLVVPPSDLVQAANLMEHVRVEWSRSAGGALLILPTSYNARHSLYGYESLGTFNIDSDVVFDDTQTASLWKCGTLTPCMPAYGGKESDSDDGDLLPGFQIPPPCYSMSELQHMNQYVELKPAYDS